MEKPTSIDASKYALIDLHLHLDGSLSAEAALQMAEMNNVALPTKNMTKLKKLMTCTHPFRNLDECLSFFAFPLSLMQTREAVTLAVYDLLKRMDAQKLLYVEVRFSPQLHLKGSIPSQRAVIEAALAGLDRAAEETDVRAQLILCCMRGADNAEANRETIEIAPEFIGRGAAAVDLAGAEALYPTSDYQTLFERIRALGLPYTLHAGEAGSAADVETALDFGTKRIGHGIRACRIPALRARIRELGVTLEVCPTSNLKTNALTDARTIRDYPFDEMLADGVPFTLNTDDMTVVGTTLKDEFQLFFDNGLLTPVQAEGLVRNAVSAAFLSDSGKAALWEKCRKRMG